MPIWTLIFLVVLGAGLATGLYLSQRQISHVRRHAGKVPGAFADRVTLAAHRRAADYTIARVRLSQVQRVVGALVLLGWTLGGGLDWLATQSSALPGGHYLAGLALLLGLFLISGLIDLPLELYSQFRLEERFGFNRTTPATFGGDLGRNLLVGLMLGLPLGFVVLWLMANGGSYWWLWAWAAWIAFAALVAWLYPVLIAPLFNRFEPLAQADLRARIEALMQRTGFNGRDVQVMDGSRRSSHGNAYFTGLGRNKRIVFFDTLLERLEPAEVEAVLAHELGHYRLRHVRTRLVSGALGMLAVFGLLAWLIDQPWFFAGLGVQHRGDATALALLMLVGPVFGYFLSPLMAQLSRRHEYQADTFAAEHASAADLASALVKLTEDNAATLTPDPLHSAFYDSHPPVPLRLRHLDHAAT